MHRAALDETSLATFLEALSQAGLRDLKSQRIDSPIGLLAWMVSGRKP
jgi:xanthine/CO dehydrogenase XdhC/CoxF family maturation factor